MYTIVYIIHSIHTVYSVYIVYIYVYTLYSVHRTLYIIKEYTYSTHIAYMYNNTDSTHTCCSTM